MVNPGTSSRIPSQRRVSPGAVGTNVRKEHGPGLGELEAIVRDLAGLLPVVDSDLGDYCALCGKVGGADVDLTVPTSHAQHCVWRRARELFPGPPD